MADVSQVRELTNIFSPEILAHILQFFEEIHDVCNLSRTCKLLRAIVTETVIETPVKINCNNYNLVFERCKLKLTNIRVYTDLTKLPFVTTSHILRQIGEHGKRSNCGKYNTRNAYPIHTVDLSCCDDKSDSAIEGLINSANGKFIQNMIAGTSYLFDEQICKSHINMFESTEY